jgi:hypothetical protein
VANTTDTTDAEPHDPRLLSLTLDATTISEIVAARTPNEGAKIIRKKSRVVGGFPEGLAEQLMGQLAELSAHDYRQVEAAVAMAIYGSSSAATRKRLARRRLDFRICCDGIEPGCFHGDPVDDLAIGDDDNNPTKSNDADRLLAHVEALGWKVWREEKNRELMVTTSPGEHFPLRSANVVHALVRAREKAKMKPVVAPKDTAPRVVAHLAARCAAPDTPCWPGALRTARAASGAILIDRGTRDYSAYSVTPAGVDEVDAATVERENVRFLRLEGAHPFETADLSATFPEAVAELAKLILLARPEDAWVLAGQFLASWVPDVSYSITLYVGPPGAGKTSALRETKNILDPESGQAVFGGKKSQPIRNLFVAASKRRVLTQDNVKDINDEKSNAYCVIASGASDDDRALYTDSGEVSLFGHCALIITAVKDDILRQSDLLDRGSFFELTPPKPATDEVVFKAKANAIRPKIVGGLLKGLAAILSIYDPEGNGEDSRMAATVGILRAIDKLFSPPGGAEAAYREMRKRAAGVNVENNPFILAVLRVVAEAPISKDGSKREWRGSATDLLAAASAKSVWPSTPNRNAPVWPGDGTRASKTLNTEQGVLIRLGVEFTTGKGTGGARWISLSSRVDALDVYAATKPSTPMSAPTAKTAFPTEEDMI